MKVKQKERSSDIFKDTPMKNHINGELSTRTFIDMIGDSFILEKYPHYALLLFPFTPKTGVGLPKTGVSFYCALLTVKTSLA